MKKQSRKMKILQWYIETLIVSVLIFGGIKACAYLKTPAYIQPDLVCEQQKPCRKLYTWKF